MKKTILNIKNAITILLLASVATLSSCSDWLNTQPSNQTSADKLFSSEKGFQEALSGVYTLMTREKLYGKEMTFGFVDVIAQQWSFTATNTSPYYGAQIYLFETELTRDLTEKMWLAQYEAIANVNDILAFVDDRKDVFEGNNQAIIKGEALALRAFLHFDILRLFAPNDFAAGSETKYIPYVNEFSKNLTESFTAKQVVDKCVKDLEEAIILLENDPIFTNKASTDLYYKNRITHLNYYAAKALLARVYFYAGEKSLALAAAKEVIAAQNATRFRWVTKDEVTAANEVNKDFTFSSEHIFALNIKKMEEYVKGSFVAPFSPRLDNRKWNKDTRTLFADEQNDYRRYSYSTESGVENTFVKFKQVEKSKLRDRMPLIKLSEMYYIATECATTAADALEYLRTIRVQRNIDTEIVDVALLDNELFKEYQKEFVGEGQLFYYYKRLNKKVETSNDKFTFVLPLPKVEIDLGGRPRPESK